jgi:hypothetical protein
MPARISTVGPIVGLMTGILLAACSGGATPSPSGTPAPTPSPAPVESAVHGVGTCTIANTVVDGNIISEQFRCTEETSDPRVDGSWEAWIVTTETGGGLGWYDFEPVMTNGGGTWRGTGFGLLTGMPTDPINYGETVWVGEDGYAGLTYHELFAGGNARQVTAGWIEPTK